jgi:hypothetical protein
MNQTQLEPVARAIAYALGANGDLQWRDYVTVAEAAVSAMPVDDFPKDGSIGPDVGRWYLSYEGAEVTKEADVAADIARQMAEIAVYNAVEAERVVRSYAGSINPAASGITIANDGQTSPEVARIAARGLADPLSLAPDEIQAVCGSALVQR